MPPYHCASSSTSARTRNGRIGSSPCAGSSTSRTLFTGWIRTSQLYCPFCCSVRIFGITASGRPGVASTRMPYCFSNCRNTGSIPASVKCEMTILPSCLAAAMIFCQSASEAGAAKAGMAAATSAAAASQKRALPNISVPLCWRAFGDPRGASGLADRARIHLRQQRAAPIIGFRQDELGGARFVIAGADTGRVAATLHRLHRFEQQPARRHNRFVGGAEILAAAIDDQPHALLHGAILLIDAGDAGEGLCLLHRAIDAPIIAAVAQRAEAVLGVDMRPISIAARARHLALADRLVAIAVIEIPHHAILVVHRHPVMAVDLLLIGTRRTELRERHDEVIAADIKLLAAERPDAVIAIAVIGEIDLERRRAALDTDIVRR